MTPQTNSPSRFPLAVARLTTALHCMPKITPPHTKLTVLAFSLLLLLLSCSQGETLRPDAAVGPSAEEALRLLLSRSYWRVAAVRLRVEPDVTIDPHWDDLRARFSPDSVLFYRIEDHLTEQPDGTLLPSHPHVPVGRYAFRTAAPYVFIDTLRLLPSMGADGGTVVLSGGEWVEMVFALPPLDAVDSSGDEGCSD